jgi:hypothetical protein
VERSPAPWGGIVFEQSEAPFPRLWARDPAPSLDRATDPPIATGVVVMFFVCLLFLTVRFC